MSKTWEKIFSTRADRMQSSAIRDLLKISSLPGVISFAGGMPSPDAFPIERFIEASQKILREQGDKALQYSTTEGYLPLRQFICDYSAKVGIHIQPENVLITNGSQQALDLIGKVFIDPGDPVLAESPTYIGAIQAWNVYGVNFITVETDKDGMIPESLESQMDNNPKLLYLLPNFQNPMGTTLPLERREETIKICHKHEVLIIEDDPYGKLRYEGKHLPTAVKLDADIYPNSNGKNQGNVIYLSTFSKILVPGLRLAWVIAPEEIIRKLVQAKQGSDLHTSTFNQYLAYEICRDDFLDSHLPVIRAVYNKRRDLMMDLIDTLFPSDVSYLRPNGGLFLWVTTPEELNTEDMLPLAVENKVAYIPGGPFHTDGTGKNTMRLNFSNASEEEIRIGMQRLSDVLRAELD